MSKVKTHRSGTKGSRPSSSRILAKRRLPTLTKHQLQMRRNPSTPAALPQRIVVQSTPPLSRSCAYRKRDLILDGLGQIKSHSMSRQKDGSMRFYLTVTIDSPRYLFSSLLPDDE